MKKIKKQELIKLYVTQKKASNEISKIWKTSPRYVTKLRHKYNILTLNSIARLSIPKKLYKKQKQVLYGVLLSDGHIRIDSRYPKVMFSQAVLPGHTEFFNYVVKILGSYATRICIRKRFSKLTNKDRYQHIFVTHCHPVFMQAYKDFVYNNKKRLSTNIFSKEIFTPLMLAVWFMGDGSNSKGRIKLSTHSFTYKEHLMMKRVFKKFFNINIIICKHNYLTKPTHISSSKEKYSIRLLRHDSRVFINLVKPYVVKEMSYKLFLPSNYKKKNNRKNNYVNR